MSVLALIKQCLLQVWNFQSHGINGKKFSNYTDYHSESPTLEIYMLILINKFYISAHFFHALHTGKLGPISLVYDFQRKFACNKYRNSANWLSTSNCSFPNKTNTKNASSLCESKIHGETKFPS